MGAVKSLTARDWTVADAYELLPGSGVQHYEVIDGELFVGPEVTRRHQRRIFDIGMVLYAACPPHLHVSGGPVTLDIGNQRHLEPDLVVEPAGDIDAVESVPLLVVEVLSPSNRAHDTHRKRAVYQELGVPSYWLVDPLEPSVTALDLEGGEYVETARVGRGGSVELRRPFPVRLAPGEWSRLD